MNKLFWLYIFSSCIILNSCKEEYQPQVVPSDKTFLVVEGFLNSASGPTHIRLSRTTPLSDAVSQNPVSGAQLVVEGRDQRTYPLFEASAGDYISQNLGIAAGSEYRLLINFPDGRKYRSDFVMAKETPAIDSITWERDEEGVEIAVTTHDPSNNSKYYQWDYQETWEFHSRYFASVKLIGRQVVPRDLINDNVYYCWRHQSSTSLFLGSSTRLDADVIYKKPLLQIPNASVKLSVRYSILVRQYVLDQKGYEFLQVMKKNTETLGSIFDAQPSEVRGNIHSITDPGELVIGYIYASSVMEKRLFIRSDQVPNWGYVQGCTMFEVANHPDSIEMYFPMLMPYEAHMEGLSIVGYYSSDPSCVDCTLRGTNKKPSFW